MDIFQAVILGIVQGLTEFLPISSSGHLVIFQKLFGFTQAPIAIDTLVHFGTLVSLIFFFWSDIKKVLKDKKLILLLIIGTIPVVIVGFLLQEKIEAIFNSLLLVGISFLITATILFFTRFVKNSQKNIKEIGAKDAIIVGLFQALSILPGVSRSGSTISGSLFCSIKKEDAFNFSFYLGMIAILGATILQIPEILNFNADEAIGGFVGFFFAAVVGFFALKGLKKVVINGKLYYFGIYCAIIGIICIISQYL
ncbi:MAG: undecaprenyl-diphosphate phosphatase [Minisyncoccales bacterium]